MFTEILLIISLIIVMPIAVLIYKMMFGLI